MSLKINIGKRFGMLTIIKEDGKFIQPSGQSQRAFLCKCECGNETRVRLSHIIRGRIISCGCISGERSGDAGKSKLYNKWRSIKDRCYRNKFDKHYYLKGIKMCNEWHNSYLTFKKWCLNNGYKEGLTIDRIDNNGNYEPSNCRFVTPRDNCNNRGNTFNVIYNNKAYPFTQLLRDKDLLKHQAAIRSRIKRGWSAQKAIDTPLRKGKYYNTGYKYQWS